MKIKQKYGSVNPILRVQWMLLLGILSAFSSCIQPEAPNAEADIIGCEVPGIALARPIEISNYEVVIDLQDSHTDVSRLAPTFVLTPGATIEPASGTPRDFNLPQTYTVTSEDRQWHKTYTVKVQSQEVTTDFHFEHVKYYGDVMGLSDNDNANKYFQIFYETDSEGKENLTWGSGNEAMKITLGNAPAQDYPTSQWDEGYRGKCAKLTTLSTGAFGAMMKAPIAAGNLFTGSFELNIAAMAKSTHFGIPFPYIPTMLTGYYKYRSGEKYQDADGKVIARKDSMDIYAVLFETDDKVTYLDGTNALTSDRIVLMARVMDGKETDEWTPFTAEFMPVENRKVDMEKLKAKKYSLAIVMSSSRNGALFKGAVGSTLWVDELSLHYQ